VQNGQGSGSLIIDVNQPYFYITASEHGVYTGEPVNKVGRTTGWTAGHVTKTCDTEWPENYQMLKCNHETDYYSEAGDSGSPVFTITNGGLVTLVGLHWGRNGNRSVYSGYRSIETDFGQLDTGNWNPRWF